MQEMGLGFEHVCHKSTTPSPNLSYFNYLTQVLYCIGGLQAVLCVVRAVVLRIGGTAGSIMRGPSKTTAPSGPFLHTAQLAGQW